MTTLRVLFAAVVATVRWSFRIWRAHRSDDARRRAHVCRAAPREWSRAFLDAARVEVDLQGVENLRDGAPAILVANHESWYDVFALATHLPVVYRFVAKKELEKVPLFGPSWMACGHISIDRSDRSSAIRSLEQASRRMRDEGGVVIMFPEGTRSPTGRMLPFKKGAFMLALQMRVPVVPVGISGSRDIMPKGSWRIRPGRTITIRIGEPIPIDDLGERDRDGLLVRARDAVERLRAPATIGTKDP